ncbi:MAG: peptide/nickel transport system permease protein, partial [Patiriisocius sp.]
MGSFLVRRFGVMVLTALCLTFIVFSLTNLEPNLEKLAKSEGNMRMSDAQVQSWLEKNGYRQPILKRYGEWLGVVPGWTRTDDEGKVTGRCIRRADDPLNPPNFCGLMQGDWGFSLVFKVDIGGIIAEKLA